MNVNKQENVIESKNNKAIKELKSLSDKKYRDELGLFIADGLRFVNEIPESVIVDKMIFSETFAEKSDLSAYGKKTNNLIISDKLFSEISETKNPQGIMAVCKKNQFNAKDIVKKGGFYILAEEMNDPGNLGTVIRTAHAAGADGIFLSKGSVDIYNSKVLRSTMGSIFKIPVVQNINLDEIAELLHKNSIKLYAAHLKGRKNHYEEDYTGGCAFLLGNEARGLSEHAVSLCDELIKIPMPGGAESLNASVAAAVLMYEAVRQKMLR